MFATRVCLLLIVLPASAAACGCLNAQLRGLSSLLLLSPGRLLQQLGGLEALLAGRQPRAVAVQLLLRLGTRVSLPEAQVRLQQWTVRGRLGVRFVSWVAHRE